MYQYSHQNIVDNISSVENNFPVQELMYKGIKIWPLIKADFYFQMMLNFSGALKTPYEKKSWKQKLGDIILAFKNYKSAKKEYKKDLKVFEIRNSIPTKANKIFITFSTFRNRKIKDYYYDSQVDTFFSTVKNTNDFCVLEFSFTTTPNSPTLSVAHDVNILKKKADMLVKKEKVKHRILNLFGIDNDKKKEDLFTHFEKFLIDSKISPVFNPQYICEQADWILFLKDELKKLYQQLEPSYVICPSYFNHESFASTLACYELGIKSIEMQHGVYSQTIYSYAGKMPMGGYEIIPNYFFSWDDKQADLINKWALKTNNHKAYQYGLNALTFWKTRSDSFVNDAFIQLQPLFKQKNKIKVLYTISDLVDEKLPKLIQQTKDTCFWFIRNHPKSTNAPYIIEFKRQMKEMSCENFEITLSTEAPLYSLLWEMDYHLTSISSVVCEAYQINLPSIVVCDSGKEVFHDFYQNSSLVIFSTNESEIFNIITTPRSTINEIKEGKANNFEAFLKNIQ